MSPKLAAEEVAVGTDSDECEGVDARVEVFARVKAKTLSVDAATMLGVSYRQAKRLSRRFRARRREGLAAPAARGGASNRATSVRDARARVGADPREVQRRCRRRALGRPWRRSISPSEDDVDGRSRDVAALDAGGGPVESRARTPSPHRQRRERKAHFGELVQLDGSFHIWS